MAWQKLVGETPTITIRSNGKIEWGDEVQRQIDTPEGIELFYDSDANRLGLRGVALRGVACIVVAHMEEDHYYEVDADYELDAAGIKPDEDIEGTLTGPTTLGAGEGGEAGIFWVSLA